MSHIVEIQTEVRNPVAVSLACDRLRLPKPKLGTFEVFTKEVTGMGVELPGWRYPVVCDLGTGNIQMDDFGGRWGDRAQLERFLQAYAVEVAKVEARKKGHTVVEQALKDGSIKLTVQVGGAL